MKTLKNILAISCVAALAIPAGVSAKGPSGDHGKSGEQHGKAHSPKTKANKRCKKTPRAGFNVTGTVVSYDAASNTLVVDVDKVSRHAKKYVTDDPLTVTGAKVGDTAPKAGDKIKVHGKIDKPKKKCTESDEDIKASVKYTKAHVVTPDADEQKPETETEKPAENTPPVV